MNKHGVDEANHLGAMGRTRSQFLFKAWTVIRPQFNKLSSSKNWSWGNKVVPRWKSSLKYLTKLNISRTTFYF